MMYLKTKLISVFLLLFLFLLPCILLQEKQLNRFPPQLEWKYSDLRLLDPVDADSSHEDIVAIYLRSTKTGILNFRVDLLNLSPDSQNSIVVAVGCRLDARSNNKDNLFSIPWDYQLWLPLSGTVKVVGQNGKNVSGSKYWISRDTRTSQLQLGIGLCDQIRIPTTRIQVAIVSPEGRSLDISAPFSLDTSPPPKVKLLPIFWNFFPASTPAQALRSWDGAHTGKDSGRHGLRYLIESVRSYRISVFLLRYGGYREFAMLDFVGVDGLLFDLCGLGLIEFLDFGEDGYAQLKNSKSNIAIWITDISSFNDFKIKIFNASQFKFLFLGGNLQESVFGDAESSLLFRFLKEQLWLEPIREYSVIAQNKSLRDQLIPFFDERCDFLNSYNLSEMTMRNSSGTIHFVNPALEAMKQLYLSSNNPYEPIPDAVRQEYLNFSEKFLGASHWISNSSNNIFCSATECIFTSNSFYSIISKEGGYMSLLFTRLPNGYSQILGPTFQLTALRSDISTWNIDKGLKADPKQIPGAFYNNEDLFFYEHWIGQNSITLFNPSTNETKKFTFSENEIQYSSVNKLPYTLSIPLILNPWIMRQEDWEKLYEQNRNGHTFTWKLKNLITVDVITSAAWNAYTFIDSLDVISLPENPNFPYPPGHYLPAPLAQLDIECPETCTITIKIKNP